MFPNKATLVWSLDNETKIGREVSSTNESNPNARVAKAGT